MHSAVIATLVVVVVVCLIEINRLTHQMLGDLEKLDRPFVKDEQSTDKD